MLAVLLPLLAPTMACALPNAHLSPAERACCKQMRQMGGECGGMAMPASQDCCHKQVPTITNWNAAVQYGYTNIQIDLAAIAELPPAILPPFSVAMAADPQWPGSTLPQSPPSLVSVLRI